MKLLLVLVQREFREGIRQRALIGTLSVVLGTIAFGGLVILMGVQSRWSDPDFADAFGHWMGVAGAPVEDPGALVAAIVVTLQLLVFNQLMSMTAVMAGHAGIHDRLSGTLPFLLLAPVGRFPLLVGKVLGALAVPFVVYLVIGGTASVGMAMIPAATESAGSFLPPSAGWIVSFLFAAPAWSLATGTLCVLISSVARDVRTAQQAAWAVVFFATFVLSPILVLLVPEGPVVQAVAALVGLGIASALLAIGARGIGRELRR